MRFQYFYSDRIGNLDIVEKFCGEKQIDLDIVNVDYDEEAVDDYTLKSIPALLIYDDNDYRKGTHYGRLDNKKLNEIYLKVVD